MISDVAAIVLFGLNFITIVGVCVAVALRLVPDPVLLSVVFLALNMATVDELTE